ncbi:nickel-dependent hydrogenase large subunit [Corynebacterium sp. H113]|uniref:nickel-dependent hydrogenase large subunit n=1 Tax=Corynebacterium sp. H113 TaxID=3133419 RepID=UPI0030A28D67
MARETLQLDEFVDPFEATLTVDRAPDGTIQDVAFDLSGLPRVDSMLVGRAAVEVPDVVKRLCGICPVVHHLAGVAALDALCGVEVVPPTAAAIRRLLNVGSIFDTIAPKYFSVDQAFAIELKKFGKLLLAAAGCPGHFPDVAIPGGVRGYADAEKLDAASVQLPQIRDKAQAVLGGIVDDDPDAGTYSGAFAGYNLAAVNRDGDLDALGGWVAARREASPEKIMFPAAQWHEYVSETVPGAAAPRPVITVGQVDEQYRVGPIARTAVGAENSATANSYSVGQAQAQLVLDALDEAAELLAQPELLTESGGGQLVADGADAQRLAEGTGIGIIDGPRGLLVHSYTADHSGQLIDCQILTPTAQNEPWLASMLRASLVTHGSNDGHTAIEESIRAADPCLPVSSAPQGHMNVRFAQMNPED